MVTMLHECVLNPDQKDYILSLQMGEHFLISIIVYDQVFTHAQ